MTDDKCLTCKHMTRIDGDPWCASPQIKATFRAHTRCLFERDNYQHEHGRDKPYTRKCGPDALNYEAK